MKKIVLLSGGKDSTATLFKVLEEDQNVIPVFCDTKWEHPITYQYLKELEKFTGIQIITLHPETNMLEIVKKSLPNTRIRRCTSELKRIPLRRYLRSIKEDIVLFYGVRKSESHERQKKYKDIVAGKKYTDKTFNCKKQAVYAVYPIIDWTEEQVIQYIKEQGFYLNPLYEMGFKRVGCFPCICSSSSKQFRLCLLTSIGRKNIESILKIIDENYDWKYVERISKNFIVMKKCYEQFKRQATLFDFLIDNDILK